MSMLKREMKKGIKCQVIGHAIDGDMKSPLINSKGVILENPIFSTVLVELENPPVGINKRFKVPVGIVYWTKQ